ncbi:MAG TPA: nuclease A inhibitor family protein [Pyrinomonadaceae bacterium]|jgi:hypothetical protein
MTDAQLLEALRGATRGLTYMSESDYPFEVFDWGAAEPTPEFLRGLDGGDADAPVETRTADEFFRGANSFQTLRRLLEENLSDLKVFRVGAINVAVYVAGRAASGSWLGVSTRVVET